MQVWVSWRRGWGFGDKEWRVGGGRQHPMGHDGGSTDEKDLMQKIKPDLRGGLRTRKPGDA